MSPQRHRSAQQQLPVMTSNSSNRHPVSGRGSRAVHCPMTRRVQARGLVRSGLFVELEGSAPPHY